MAIQWVKTKFLGVRYREHATRKHGLQFDKCFSIRYKIESKDKEEVVGWASEGVNAEKAFNLLSELRENIRKGVPPFSLGELREKAKNEHNEKIRIELDEQNTKTSLNTFWEREYLPSQIHTKKERTLKEEVGIYNRYIKELFGHKCFSEITIRDVEFMINSLLARGKAPATARHALALLSQIWNTAFSYSYAQGENPCSKVHRPQKDNRRMRFLTYDEAKLLLQELKAHSTDVHDTAILSLFAGLRASEIHSLTWHDINFEQGTIFIKDPKNKHSRHAYITPEIHFMLYARMAQNKNCSQLVFPTFDGKPRKAISDTFERVVEKLGFNEGIDDSRQKVVFHSLRHTFASWLVQTGTPLYTVAELMGHKTLEMTKRYSHLAPDTIKKAAFSLSGVLKNVQ